MNQDKTYDIFLSYHHSDAEFVHQIDMKLRANEVKTFIDEINLLPGDLEQEEIEKALRKSRSFAVFLGKNDLQGWVYEQMRIAIQNRIGDPSFRVIPILAPGATFVDPSDLPDFLNRAYRLDYRKGISDTQAFYRLLQSIRNERKVIKSKVKINPYQGLRYFDEDSEEFFFGRDSYTQRVLEHLKSHNFLAVIAPSGSGKSSLLRAGVIPQLKTNAIENSNQWRIIIITPDRHPIENLAVALAACFHSKNKRSESMKLQDDLLEDSRSLHLEARQSLNNESQQRIFLFIDQFEELFALCEDETERKAFLNSIFYAVSHKQSQMTVVIGMRADFYAQATNYSQLADNISNKQITLSPMTVFELREAIEFPAHKVGLSLEQGLTQQIISDFLGEPGALPLLQHTLYELWYKQDRGILSLSGYQEIGGVRGAISKRAEKEYQALTKIEQQIARRILLRLVQPGEGSEDTRRRTSIDELYTRQQDKEAVNTVINRLTNSRLITSSVDERTNIEKLDVAHEALIRGWPTLQKWIDTDRDSLKLHRKLSDQANEWLANEQDDAYLYRGGVLITAHEWAVQNFAELSQTERKFLTASSESEKKQQVQELENAKNLAEEAEARTKAEEKLRLAAEQRSNDQQRYINRLRFWSSASAIIGVFAVFVAILFFSAQTTARQAETVAKRESRESQARELTAKALNITSLKTKLLVGTESINVTKTDGVVIPVSEENLRSLLPTQYRNVAFEGHESTVINLVYSPDGSRLASGSWDNTVRIWNVNDPTSNPFVFTGHVDSVNSLTYNPDGSRLASGSRDNTVRIWNVNDPSSEPVKLIGHEGEVTSLSYISDGSMLASGSRDGTVRIWNVNDPFDEPQILTGQEDKESEITNLVFSQNNNRLAIGSSDGTLRLWNVIDLSSEPIILSEKESTITTMVFSLDGHLLAVGSNDGNVRVWNLNNLDNTPLVLIGNESPVYALVYSPDSRGLASGGYDGTLRIWNVKEPTSEPLILKGSKTILSIDYSPDGKRLATGIIDGTVRIWNVDEPINEPITLTGHEASILNVVYSTDGRWLASGGIDGKVWIWNVKYEDSEPLVLSEEEGDVSSLAYSPNGQWLALGGSKGEVRIWNVSDRDSEPLVLKNYVNKNSIYDLFYNSEGNRLVSASLDNSVQIWNVTGVDTKTVFFKRFRDIVTSIAYSHDGSKLAIGSRDGTIRVWNVEGRDRKPHVLKGHSDVVTQLVFSPDDQQLASGSDDATLRIWNVDNREGKALVFREHESEITTLAYSPNGDKLASGSLDGTIRIWNYKNTTDVSFVLIKQQHISTTLTYNSSGSWLASGSRDGVIRIWNIDDAKNNPRVLRGHEDYVNTLIFKPDDSRLASGSDDGTIRIWNVNDRGNESIILRAHEGRIVTLEYSPDGTRLVSASKDGTVRIWRTNVQEIIDIACGVAGRNLTQAEWNQYIGDEPYRQTCDHFPIGGK